MDNRTGRIRRTAALFAMVSLLTAGCGAGIGVDGAARVGDTVVSQAGLQDLADGLLPADSAAADRAGVNRALLTKQIRSALLDELAEARGVTATGAEVVQELQGVSLEMAAMQLGVPEDQVRDEVAERIKLLKLASTALEAPWSGEIVQVEIDGLVAPDLETARLLQAELSGPQAERAFADHTAQTIAPAVASNVDPSTAVVGRFGLFSAAVGDVVVVDLGGEYRVIRVLDRAVTQGTADLRPFTQAQDGLDLVTPLLLAATPGNLDVSVDPRFGRWDPVAVAVVP